MDMSLIKLGICDAQGGLACCSPWVHKESDMTEWLNWTELILTLSWIHHCSFDLCFSNNYWCSASFHVSLAISMSSLENYLDLLHIFWLGFLFFWHRSAWAVCIFWRLIPVSYAICKYFLPSWRLFFCFVLLMVSFAVQKLLSLIRFCLLLFLYITLGGGSKKLLLRFM